MTDGIARRHARRGNADPRRARRDVIARDAATSCLPGTHSKWAIGRRARASRASFDIHDRRALRGAASSTASSDGWPRTGSDRDGRRSRAACGASLAKHRGADPRSVLGAHAGADRATCAVGRRPITFRVCCSAPEIAAARRWLEQHARCRDASVTLVGDALLVTTLSSAHCAIAGIDARHRACRRRRARVVADCAPRGTGEADELPSLRCI